MPIFAPLIWYFQPQATPLFSPTPPASSSTLFLGSEAFFQLVYRFL